MGKYMWPTAEVIKAKWVPANMRIDPLEERFHFIRRPNGAYWGPDCFEFCTPGIGHFEDVTELVPSDELEKRTAEVRQLQQALTRKNTRLRRYKEDLRRASDKSKEAHSKDQRAERLAQAGVPRVIIYKKNNNWIATVKYGACSYITFEHPTHAGAMKWAENKLKELRRDRPVPRATKIGAYRRDKALSLYQRFQLLRRDTRYLKPLLDCHSAVFRGDLSLLPDDDGSVPYRLARADAKYCIKEGYRVMASK